MIKYVIVILMMLLPHGVSAVVVGIGVNQFVHDSFDIVGQAFTKELKPHSIRVGYEHGDHDFGVNWAAQNGMGVVFFLGYAKGCDPMTADGRQCYADRSAGLAQKYGSKVQYYEVWNEWNGGIGLGCQWNTPPCNDGGGIYTDLLCRTYKAIKAVRPSAKVVAGVTSGVHLAWTSKMYDAGAGNCMDAISVHPYVYLGSRDFEVARTAPASTGVDKFVQAITAQHNQGLQKTGRSIPILVTEEGRPDDGSSGGQQLSAAYLTELYKRAESIPFLEGIWWYTLEDGVSDGYGVLRHNNTKKQAFFAFQTAAGAEPSPPAPPVVVETSSDGTTIPPALYIGDDQKRAWTLSGGKVYLDGAVTPSSGVNLLLKDAGVIYQRNLFENWWKWMNGVWVNTVDPRAALPPPVPSPDGVTIPPAPYIVDKDNRVWRVHAGRIYIDGSPVPSSSVTLLLKHESVIYQRNIAGNWWKWTNGLWIVTKDPRVVQPPPPEAPPAGMLCEHGADVRHTDSGVVVSCQ